MGTPNNAYMAAYHWIDVTPFRSVEALAKVFETLSDADLATLVGVTPRRFPQLAGDAVAGYTVTLMPIDEFPLVANTNRERGYMNGILGQPENNLYANLPKAQPWPPA